MSGPLRAADATRCAEIEWQLFADDSPWPAQAFVEEINSPHNRYFGERVNGELIGYGGISVLGTAGHYECEIHTIGVDARYQGQGYGYSLLNALLDVADAHDASVFLEVRTDNAHAQELYRRNGFEQIGLRRRYYQPSGADAYTMRRASVSERQATRSGEGARA